MALHTKVWRVHHKQKLRSCRRLRKQDAEESFVRRTPRSDSTVRLVTRPGYFLSKFACGRVTANDGFVSLGLIEIALRGRRNVELDHDILDCYVLVVRLPFFMFIFEQVHGHKADDTTYISEHAGL